MSHEIRQISQNLPDFTKSTEFHEIRQISKDHLPGIVTPMFVTFLCFHLNRMIRKQSRISYPFVKGLANILSTIVCDGSSLLILD